MTALLSTKEQMLAELSCIFSGQRKVRMVNSVPAGAVGYDVWMGHTVYHKFDEDGFFYASGNTWTKHLSKQCWEITRLGCDLPERSKNLIPMVEDRSQLNLPDYSQSVPEYYRAGRRFVGD